MGEAKKLEDTTADCTKFEEHLKEYRGQEIARWFLSLSKEPLVAPAWVGEDADTYAHLAKFVQKASDKQQLALWQKLGEALKQKLEEKTSAYIWVSTSGTGVPWLHLRIDSKPKYYTFEAYKDGDFVAK